MGGPNLEVFKFGVYVFFPVLMFWHFGDPAWYDRHVTPYKDKLFPPEHKTVRNLPTDKASIRERIEMEMAARRAAKAAREGGEVEQAVPEATPPVKAEEPKRLV